MTVCRCRFAVWDIVTRDSVTLRNFYLLGKMGKIVRVEFYYYIYIIITLIMQPLCTWEGAYCHKITGHKITPRCLFLKKVDSLLGYDN